MQKVKEGDIIVLGYDGKSYEKCCEVQEVTANSIEAYVVNGGWFITFHNNGNIIGYGPTGTFSVSAEISHIEHIPNFLWLYTDEDIEVYVLKMLQRNILSRFIFRNKVKAVIFFKRLLIAVDAFKKAGDIESDTEENF